jgi:hypothetical protein
MPVSIEVRNVRVRSLSVDYVVVSWEIENTTEDVLDYTFQVLRSEAAMGPFDPISAEMEDRYIFVDNSVKVANAFRQSHYIIRVKRKSDNTVQDFGPTDREPAPDLVATEIRKHVNLLMREFVGRRCWVLPVRTFGQRCTCYDTRLKQRTRSGCRLCYDTGFIRGYHHPIETWIQFDPSANANQQTNVGELQQQNTTMRLGYFPPVKPKDIVVEPENVRWRVVSTSSTQRLRAAVHQEVQVHRIPPTDSEYLIAIDMTTREVDSCGRTEVVDINNVQLSEERNFTNPHTLENFEREEYEHAFESGSPWSSGSSGHLRPSEDPVPGPVGPPGPPGPAGRDGSAGSASISEVEIDFGSTPIWSAVVSVADAAITPASKIVAVQSGAAATGRDADENEMDQILFCATPGSGSMQLIARPQDGAVSGKFKVNYLIG